MRAAGHSNLNALPVHLPRQIFYSFLFVFMGFFVSERSQDDSMLDLVLGGVLEASWGDIGRLLGRQDAPKMAQDGAKMAQDGAKISQGDAKTANVALRLAKMAPRRAKMAPRRVRMVPRRAKMMPRRATMEPR